MMDLRGTKWSPLRIQCPIRRVKVKKTHYKALLILASGAIWLAHHHMPDYEMHAVFATNLLFIFDPTV